MLIETLIELIKIDTRTAISNETQAALYLKKVCDDIGIENEIIEPARGKGSFIAHIHGQDKSKKELLLLSHLDTSEFGQLDKWKFHPLSAAEYNGEIIGRGAIDCKGLTSLWLSIITDIKKKNLKPQRGIVFVAAADEESGGKFGMEYLMKKYPLINNCGYAIGEGGGFPIKLGKNVYYLCQNCEKGLVSYEVENRNILTDECKDTFIGNKVLNLVRGLLFDRVYDLKLISFLIRNVFEKPQKRRVSAKMMLCDSYCFKKTGSNMFLDISAARQITKKAVDRITKKEGMLPGDLKFISETLPNSTKVDTGLYKIISKQMSKASKNNKIVPYTTPGYSDNRFLRYKGIVVYGFFPLSLNERASGIHGYNERISIDGLKKAHEVMYNVVTKFTKAL